MIKANWLKKPQEIMKHLQDTFCDDEEEEDKILKQYRVMNVKYDPSDMIQVYFKVLQDACTILVSLSETINNKVLIRQAIGQFNKHMNLNESVDEWKKKLAVNKTWTEFKTHFSKAITKNQKRSGTLKEIGIANQVQEQVSANCEHTETVVQFQLEQAQTIVALTARLALLKATKNQAYDAQVPPTVTTPTASDEMSQITTMLQAVMAAQAQTCQKSQNEGDSTHEKKGKRQWTTQENDLPNGQRSKRRHPTSDSYCHSCGYDLPPEHDSKTCKWKKTATECNCFHYKSP
jgi:hypothetical protein